MSFYWTFVCIEEEEQILKSSGQQMVQEYNTFLLQCHFFASGS